MIIRCGLCRVNVGDLRGWHLHKAGKDHIKAVKKIKSYPLFSGLWGKEPGLKIIEKGVMQNESNS